MISEDEAESTGMRGATMTRGLYSRCMGGNSTILAMARCPEEFTHIQALVLLNVVSGKTFTERGAENLHSIQRKQPTN